MNSARRVSSAVRGLPLSVQLSLGMWALSRRCWRDTAMTLPNDGLAGAHPDPSPPPSASLSVRPQEALWGLVSRGDCARVPDTNPRCVHAV